MPKGFCLGFDFGSHCIGVAVGQTVTTTASPIATIKAKRGIPDWQATKKLIDQWHPDTLIVGFPLHMDGTEMPITAAAYTFAEQLHLKFNLPVYLVDERLTTKAAREEIFAQQGFKGLTKEHVDGISAKLILESWLNEKKFLKKID
jgi:putative Holliday junction resolvase